MPPESELEMVERHIRQSHRLVHRQKEIIEGKRRCNRSTALSEQVLESLEMSLELHQAHLDQLQKLPPGGQQ